MTERLLQYIWQYQYFNASLLVTTDEQPVQVLHPGIYNTNQGPDFLNARIKVGNTLWVGSVEIHIVSSDWLQHKHSNDKNYNNVILHVVWKDVPELVLSFPTLELHNRVSKILLQKYDGLMQASRFIPCESQIKHVNALILTLWKERLLIERLQQKTKYIETILQQNKQHWNEVFWWILARNFGAKMNSEAFECMAQNTPLKIISKHKDQLYQLEALLMGQSGLLEANFKEEYPLMLQKEYRFLQKKYSLKKNHFPVYFLRMRPANFPTIRLAQLAVLIHKNSQLFSVIKESENFIDAAKWLSVNANGYWLDHYLFDEVAVSKKKSLGKQMIQNIMINTIIPVIYAYGYFNNKEKYKTKAMQWMEQLPAESNNITKSFELIGIENKTAFDSQALIQLKNRYCDNRQCLQCSIGNKILKLS